MIDPSVQYRRLKPGTKIYFHTIDDKLVLGPKLTSDGDVTIYTLGEDGVFKNHSPKEKVKGKSVKYTVLKSGVLVPKSGGKSIKYNYGENGDLIPDSCNECVYRSNKPTYYIKGFKDILIPVEMLYSKDKLHGMFKDKVLFSKALKTEKEMEKELEAEDQKPVAVNATSVVPSEIPSLDLETSKVVPDKTCNGEVTLFILKSDGSFKRTPSDPYLPTGMKMSYKLMNNLLLKPLFGRSMNDFVISYLTGNDGDLIPHRENRHEIKTEPGSLLSFMLGERGYIFPVKEKIDSGKSVSYYFNGNLIHRSQQFSEVFANSSTVLINNERYQLPDVNSSPKLKCGGPNGLCQNPEHHICKRKAYTNPVYDSCTRNSYQQYSDGPYQSNYQPRTTYRAISPPVNTYETYRPPPPPPPRRCPSQTQIIPQPPYVPPVSPPYQPPIVPPYQPPVLPPVAPSYQPPILPPARPCPSPPTIPPVNTCSRTCPSKVPLTVPLCDLEPVLNCDCPTKEPQVRTDLYISDNNGNQISIIPEITNDCDVVLYKLTCKGQLIRFPECTEPEYGYDILFELLLEEFILVPTSKPKGQFTLTYQLQENGNLVPEKWNKNTFKKPPGSLLYFMLGKNNILFPVQQRYECDGSLSFFFQNKFLVRLASCTNKPIYFTTLSTPIYAYVNNFTMITCSSKPRISPCRGSNWRQFRSSSSSEESAECCSKNIYLVGPKRQNIKIVPYKNRKGVPAVFILDCNGVFYRSPKDKKKCVILRSYILLKEQILVPTNETEGYMFAESKNGDMYPYLFPGGKLAAPVGQFQTYLLCQRGILLPVCIEIIGDYICYLFDNNVIFREKVLCKKSFEEPQELPCVESVQDLELFVDENGNNVYFEKVGRRLKRYPSEPTPETITDLTALFQILEDGSLRAVQQETPGEDVISLILEPNGDFKEGDDNEKEPPSRYYVLAKDGELIAATAKKTKNCITFYTKCNRRLFKICSKKNRGNKINRNKSINDEENRNYDDEPLRVDLMRNDDDNDGEDIDNNSSDNNRKSNRNRDDSREAFCKYDKIKCRKNEKAPCDKNAESVYIPIPLKSDSVADVCKCCPKHLKSKCEELKETLKELTKNSDMPFMVELNMDKNTMKDLHNWALRCDKVLNRRDLADRINDCIKNLREAEIVEEK